MFAPSPQPRPLRHASAAGLGVIGFALVCAVVIYFATDVTARHIRAAVPSIH